MLSGGLHSSRASGQERGDHSFSSSVYAIRSPAERIQVCNDQAVYIIHSITFFIQGAGRLLSQLCSGAPLVCSTNLRIYDM